MQKDIAGRDFKFEKEISRVSCYSIFINSNTCERFCFHSSVDLIHALYPFFPRFIQFLRTLHFREYRIYVDAFGTSAIIRFQTGYRSKNVWNLKITSSTPKSRLKNWQPDKPVWPVSGRPDNSLPSHAELGRSTLFSSALFFALQTEAQKNTKFDTGRVDKRRQKRQFRFANKKNVSLSVDAF